MTAGTGAAALSAAEVVQRDTALLQEGVRLLLTNEFHAAEDIFRQGAQRGRPPAAPAGGGDGVPLRDYRGAFAIVWTIVSFMFGLLSFANDQLDECLTRVWTAERLLLEDAPWVGQKMLLGMVYLIAGVVQAAKNAWLKAGVNLVRALRLINQFQEGLAYEGLEQALVRSTALFFLGLFNLVMSMLPPQVLKVASRAGGRALQGSRSDALELLSQCQAGEGVMAPFAVIVLLCFNVLIKTYLGEEVLEADRSRAWELLAWAETRFPGSVVFGFWRAELHAAQHEIAEASECLRRVHEVLGHLQLPAVDSFLEQKRAMLSISLLHWRAAAEGLERSLDVSVAKKRRSYVPFLSYLAGLCRLIDGDAAGCGANFRRVHEYSRMRKRNWVPEDELAFQKAKDYGGPPPSAFCALLDLVEVAMLKLHLLHTMPADSKRQLLVLLQQAAGAQDPEDRPDGLDEKAEGRSEAAAAQLPPPSPSGRPVAVAKEELARSWLFQAELRRLLRQEDRARRLALRGLEMTSKLGPRGVTNGTAATLHLTLAILGVEGHVEELDKCPRPSRAYDDALKFKRLGLGRPPTLDSPDAAHGRSVSFDSDALDEGGAHAQPSPEGLEEEEFFSAEEGAQEAVKPAQTSPGKKAPKWGAWSPASALKSLANAAATIKLPAAPAVPFAPFVGGAAHVGASGTVGAECDSSHLQLEALHRQADQGDCSVVAMPLPAPGASAEEVAAYLRWAHWSALRGMPRQEALRRCRGWQEGPQALQALQALQPSQHGQPQARPPAAATVANVTGAAPQG